MSKINLRSLMERSATYLAYGYEGRNGLNPDDVEKSLYFIKQWKFYFVGYMKDKPNLQKGDGSLLGEKGASDLADNIFKAFYDGEVRAFLEPTKGPYYEREPGALEYGDITELFTDRHDAMNRDDNRTHWKQVQVAKVNTTWKNKQINYGQLLSMLIKHPKKRNRILINARVMARNGAITWGQFNKLAASATDIVNSSNQFLIDKQEVSL